MKFSLQKSFRRLVQILFFIFVFTLVLFKFLEDRGVDLPGAFTDIHGICPFGAVETIGRLILVDKFIPKTYESNIWVFGGVVISTVLFGALFCGWLCPLGSIQDWVGKLGKKLLKKRYNRVPVKLDKILGNLRYIFLVLIILQTTKHISLVFVNVDPYYALFHFWTGEALPTAIAVLVVVLVSSLFVSRPWCRWLCPMGAVEGLVQLISPWKIRRDISSCIDCGKCSKACWVNIDVAKIEKVVDTRCNRCGECLDSCPVKGALDHKLPGQIAVSIKNRVLTGLIVLTLFFTPILIAKSLGLFITTHDIVVKVGTLKAEDIKGSLTIAELADGFAVETKDLLEYLTLPENFDIDTKLRNVEDTVEEITFPVIRDKMDLWQ